MEIIVHLHSYTIKFVLFAKFNRLLPAVVALVKVSGDSAELDKRMIFQLLGKGNVIKVVVSLKTGPQCFIIFVFDK